MREFPNPGGGVTIVDFGISITIANGVATVSHDIAQADYFDSITDGKLYNNLHSVLLDSDQLMWLKEKQVWVERRIADDHGN